MIEALEKVGLSRDYLNKTVYECSGGEQQRIAIAKILIKDCQIVFADEPTASLDDENKDVVFKHLRELNSKGVTIVVVSHDSDVCMHCDEVIEI